jgi:hypothetical protein
MRKLEGIVKEVVDEMGYLKRREERFTDTNSTTPRVPLFSVVLNLPFASIDKPTRPELCMVHDFFARGVGGVANLPPPGILQEEIPH